jgi:phage-related protein
MHTQKLILPVYNIFVIISMITQQASGWEIVFYQDRRGRSPIFEFIDDLPALDQAKIYNALRLLREFGNALGMPHARHVEGKLWELRPGSVRLFYFAYIGKQFVILHGYRKQSNKAPEREIALALRRMAELLEEG